MTAMTYDLGITDLVGTHCPFDLNQLRPDGSCAACDLEASIAYPAMCDAQSRLDDGEHEARDRYRLEDICGAYWACQAIAEVDAVTAPNGCAVCGEPERGHGQRYGAGHTSAATGLTWVAPTNQKRLDRMIGRRASRAGRLNPVVDRLFVRARCRTCRTWIAVRAGECRECFRTGVDLDKRAARSES